MRLHFEATEVITWLRSNDSSAHSSDFGARLIGRCHVQKDDDSSGPRSDSYSLPSYVGTTDLEDIWLTAFVNFAAPDAFANTAIYKPDWLDSESVAPRLTRANAVATIFYSEAGSEFSSYHGSGATISIELMLQSPNGRPTSTLLRTLKDPALAPSIEFNEIYFTQHESITERFGIPTWEKFLKSECPAYGGEYELTFSRRVDRRTASE